MVDSPRALSSVLVTGGAGFMGSAFIRWLFREPGFSGNVVCLDALTYAGDRESLEGFVDPSRYAFVHANVADRERVLQVTDQHRIDTVVHFAAESHVDRSVLGPGLFMQTNVMGTFHLLEVVRARPHLHLHHVSTDEVFGSLGPTGQFTEDGAYRPSSPYSASKAASDHLVRAYARTYGIQTTLSHASNNYGPYQLPEKLVPVMILGMLEHRPLPVYGDGSQVRDWLYVDDHAEAVYGVLRAGRDGETYNIGARTELTNLDLVRRLISLVAFETGEPEQRLSDLISFVTDRPGHDRRYALDPSRLERELGWAPRHDLGSGLHQTVRWHLSHRAWLERARGRLVAGGT